MFKLRKEINSDLSVFFYTGPMAYNEQQFVWVRSARVRDVTGQR